MHYKTNRQNHDFQIAYFIAGSCQTPDAAYSILCDLREDRRAALKSADVGRLRQEAKRIRAKRLLQDADEAIRLEGKADMMELDNAAESININYDAAVAELATINKCIEVLQPLRKFAHLPDAEAHEAAQFDEWKLQLIHTGQNYLITQGSIPADHFDTMRMHPAFAAEIMPALDQVQTVLATKDSKKITELLESSKLKLPPLLGLSE